ncbi:MAG: hypothetical protein QF437_08575 [Planctomycetota bacterium]|jgi:hypothetical protein|nr:hypothetical protein [Planctomycetota bacterium]MDP7130529.1 hypothetical protein [Planctomycetota bacterium]MDP7248812.1 hypothetical protein [Planctomycetota bacterium]
MNKRKQGAALTAVIIFIGVMSVITSVMLNTTRFVRATQSEHVLAAKSMAAAESGLTAAMALLDEGKEFEKLVGKVGGSIYQVVWIEGEEGKLILQATGIAARKGSQVKKVIEYRP